jgi:outer membrane protein OmpA-like peptidoglycan-associated protein
MTKTWNISVTMGLLLLLWIVGGAYWYHTNFAALCASVSNSTSEAELPKVPIQDGEHVIALTPPFRFGYGNYEPIFLSSAIHALKHTAVYLQQSPNTVLNITGWQQQTESKEANYLATLRANEVKDVLLDLGVDGDKILTSGQTSDAIAFSNNQTHEAIGFTFVNRPSQQGQQVKATASPEKVRTAAAVAMMSDANLYFPQNSANINVKNLRNDVAEYVTQVAESLQKHSDWHIRIIGHADNSEQKEDWLAQQRALALGKYLVKLGASKSQISVAQAGAAMPVATKGNAKNRRVELRWQQNM